MDVVENLTGFLKRLLGIEDVDTDIGVDDNYVGLLNSSKYADSNSNTDLLEKLVKATAKSSNTDHPIPRKLTQEPTSVSVIPLGWHTSIGESLQEEPNVKSQAESRKQTYFQDRLSEHLKLLRDLENENYLPGRPVFEREKFGKEGGANFKLGFYRVPESVYYSMKNKDFGAMHLNQALTQENYKNRFHLLLWIEEAHQAIEMRRYDIEGAMLGKHDHNNLILPVPGLAEGRPSLLRGDRLYLQSERRSTKYEGYISDVREYDILIRLHESLHDSDLDGLKFDVSFHSNRTPFRRCHHSVDEIANSPLKLTVFPVSTPDGHVVEPKVTVKETKPEELRCFNASLNEYQRKAALNVLRSTCRPAPYIVFGPPGTGKTITMVEAILQVYARLPNSRILACGNSNACADILASKILQSDIVPEKELLRLSAYYRMQDLIPDELRGITRSMDMVSAYSYRDNRVVITTCIQSGSLHDFHDRFDYVFIDEAGHANEPESLIPLSLLKADGVLVLAGDWQQLGPVVISETAESNGLGTSLLKRLVSRSVYQRRYIGFKMAYDPRYLTKLNISYRADPRVMVVNNKLFYDNELKFQVETPSKWLELYNTKNPLIFQPAEGRDKREKISPSWFNPKEAFDCMIHVNRLYKAGLKAEQLGIVTPYRGQMDKLNKLFVSLNLQKCKIATMEEFQGDEREVIIISTVRTRDKYLEIDKKFHLGFLFDRRRFNVAVSRAKWLVIVVGNEKTLMRDECWQEFIAHAHIIRQNNSNQSKCY